MSSRFLSSLRPLCRRLSSQIGSDLSSSGVLSFHGQHLSEADTRQAAEEVVRGAGCVLLREAFRPTQLDVAYLQIKEELGNLHDTNRDVRNLRVWNLVNRHLVFSELLVKPLPIIDKILGDDAILGSFSANVLLPGAQGQPPHVDYPHIDLMNKDRWPQYARESWATPLVLSTQVLFLMDDFTFENGATAFVPSSQLRAEWPEESEFFSSCHRLTANAGDALVFAGLLHHCGMPNHSQGVRTSLQACFQSKFVIPMENLSPWNTTLGSELTRDPTMRRLLRVDASYPARFDQVYGHLSDFAHDDDDAGNFAPHVRKLGLQNKW